MARKKKKRIPQRYEQPREEIWTQFDTINSDAWRDHILQITQPRIPRDVVLKVHVYKCVEAGSTGRPEQCWYVLDQTYDVRKSRWSESMVEVRGLMRNVNTGVTFMCNSWSTVPIENCKKYLKQC